MIAPSVIPSVIPSEFAADDPLLAVIAGKRESYPDIAGPTSLAFIGDSRIYESEYVWKNVSTFSSSPLPLAVGYCTGQGITSDSVGGGLLEYRASDQNMRWTAPGDSAGPWTPIFAGWNLFESATAGKGARVGIQSVTGLPETDQSVTTNVTGSAMNAWGATGLGTWFMEAMYSPNWTPKFLGLGGNRTSHVIEQLPWINEQAPGPGWDVIQLSTNDISGTVDTATIIANLTTIYNTRRALGRRLLLMGEPARWGVDTSTPLTTEKQQRLHDVNAFIESYAASHRCLFVDTYSLTEDPEHDDARPLTSMIRDTVHYSVKGAQAVGFQAASQLLEIVSRGPQRGSGDGGNQNSWAFFPGTGGTISTGATGTAPNGFQVNRASGSDATVVSAVSDRADGIEGRWLDLDVTATSGSQVIQARGPNDTLATLGLAVGDEIYLEAEVEVSGITGGYSRTNVFVQFTGGSPTSELHTISGSGVAGPEKGLRRSPVMKIPTGTTNIRFYAYVRTEGAATAKARLASAAIVKA
jgi:lysophospholipase L1-like esterase